MTSRSENNNTISWCCLNRVVFYFYLFSRKIIKLGRTPGWIGVKLKTLNSNDSTMTEKRRMWEKTNHIPRRTLPSSSSFLSRFRDSILAMIVLEQFYHFYFNVMVLLSCRTRHSTGYGLPGQVYHDWIIRNVVLFNFICEKSIIIYLSF